MKVTLLHNQSLIDIAVQVTGKAENVLQIAKDNGFEITDDVKAGTTLVFNLNAVKNDTDIINYYKANNIKPACGLTDENKQILQKLEGISVWSVGVDFVVS